MTEPQTQPLDVATDRGEPTRPTVNLTWNGPRDAALLVDGVDIARQTMTATLHLDAGDAPKLTLELAVHQVAADVAGCHVEIGPEIRALLERALWAPPDVAAQLRGLVAALTGGCHHAHYPSASPWLTVHDGGTVTLGWPDGTDYALLARETFAAIVDEHNRLTREHRDLEQVAANLRGDVEWLRGLLGEALNRWAAAAELDPDETARERARTRIAQIRDTRGTS